MRRLLPATVGAFLALVGTVSAQPIQSPQDAACRAEAQQRVFAEPGGDPYVRGKAYWQQCMARSGGGGAGKKARKKRRRG